MLDRLMLGLRFYLGFAPRFSRLGYRRLGLHKQPVTADWSGQTWLVTGASGGIGRAIVAGAVARGAEVVALARSQDKLDRLAELPHAERIRTLAVDLSLMGELRETVDLLAAENIEFDALINNVGVLLNQHALTAEGHEMSYATNLLGHYQLTEALIAGGQLRSGGVVINMSSGGMYTARLRPDRLDVIEAGPYDGVKAYAQHKRAQVELTRHWNQRHGPGIAFHVMHPGWVDTAGVETSLPGFHRLFGPVLRNTDQGADTALWLAAARPEPPSEGIWLDRQPDPEHLDDRTRSDDQAIAEMLKMLDETATTA